MFDRNCRHVGSENNRDGVFYILIRALRNLEFHKTAFLSQKKI